MIFAVKPVKRETVFAAASIREALRGKLILSIMPGISTNELKRLVGGVQDDITPQVVRAMPNMAANIREAMTLYTADTASISEENLEIASWVFNQVGRSQLIDESHFDISAVLVGCAGSLLLLAVDGMLDAAVAEGVKRGEAQNFVMNSAIGMLKLVPAGRHPTLLRESISSPGKFLIHDSSTELSKCPSWVGEIRFGSSTNSLGRGLLDTSSSGVGKAWSQISIYGCYNGCSRALQAYVFLDHYHQLVTYSKSNISEAMAIQSCSKSRCCSLCFGESMMNVHRSIPQPLRSSDRLGIRA